MDSSFSLISLLETLSTALPYKDYNCCCGGLGICEKEYLREGEIRRNKRGTVIFRVTLIDII